MLFNFSKIFFTEGSDSVASRDAKISLPLFSSTDKISAFTLFPTIFDCKSSF